MSYITYTFGIENKRFETNNKHYLTKLESFPFYSYSIFFFGKSGFWVTNLKKYKKKRTRNFINYTYFHSFKNIFKYMHFFITQIIISQNDPFIY